MKVVSAQEMARVEALAFADGADEKAFMEAAGTGVARHVEAFMESHDTKGTVYLLCGKGNNAGDAYVAGWRLLESGRSVEAFQLAPLDTCSPLCRENAVIFERMGGKIHRVLSKNQIHFSTEGVILDGIFGTGFQGEAQGLFAEAIDLASNSGLPCLSIDIPSGLNGSTGEVAGPAIYAVETYFLGLPKSGFFLQKGWNYIGRLIQVHFGLEPQYVDEANADFIMATRDHIEKFRPRLLRSRHKYQAGFVVGLAGSPGMSGAALLSGMAALRGGAGIVKLLHPEGMEGELSNCPWELITLPYSTRELDWIRAVMVKCTACYIGPGIAQSPAMRVVVNAVLPDLHIPCVIDADAINIMAEEQMQPPRQTVLTPHAAEMARLLGRPTPSVLKLDYLAECHELAEKNDVTIVLKGGPSFVLHPGELPWVIPVGDPGMATAGSGDVLTGLISALLSQGLGTMEASTAGTYLHGLAGEIAARKLTPYCMVAGDILGAFPEAFQRLWPVEAMHAGSLDNCHQESPIRIGA